MKKTLIVLIVIALILSVYAIADELTAGRGTVIRKVVHPEWHGPGFAQSKDTYALILDGSEGRFYTVYVNRDIYEQTEVGDYFR